MSPAVQRLEFSFRQSPRRSCGVLAGSGVLDRLVADIEASPPGRLLVVVSDSNVAPLHGEPLAERLRARGLAVETLGFPAGEASKTRETKASLEDALLELGAGRDTALVAVGGGVTGDLAGAVAATWHRGIPVVQVPTSLLAMADAALGGKTAVNLPGGKNLVGSFHQPWGVYADVRTLATLPEGEYLNGFAEVVKSAVIADFKFFRWLEGAVESLRRREPAALEEAILNCLRIKGRVVTRDERESGPRAILNFGHTVAHAIEAASGFELPHGPAVSIGMMVETRLAASLTGFPDRHAERLGRLLEELGLPVRIPAGQSTDAIVAASRRDKKARSGRVRYALPLQIGRMGPADRVTVTVEERTLREAVEDFASPR